MSASQNSGNGIGFGTVLFLIFLVLKLTEVIDWSWWWVTAPLWGTALFVIVVVLFCLGMAAATGQLSTPARRRR